MVPIFEAILAGLIVGAANRLLARLEQECPEVREQLHSLCGHMKARRLERPLQDGLGYPPRARVGRRPFSE